MSGVEHAIHGQLLVTAEIEVEGWWTGLDLPPKDLIRLYGDSHARNRPQSLTFCLRTRSITPTEL